MSKFGGKWTKQKIDIVESYSKAYLTIMKKRKYWKLMYFDGFAGTGEINTENGDYEIIEGTAQRILTIDSPRSFDMYYFVELDCERAKKLEKMISTNFPQKKQVFIRSEDCNKKLIDLADFLNSAKGKNYKVLAFIDPYGMELNWSSLEVLKGLGIDLWILVPTGIGANRLLKKDGNISYAWLKRLENFLGITEEQIMNKFYQKVQNSTLFGIEEVIKKESDTINKIHELYKTRLKGIFNFVSESFVMRNSKYSIMFHFFMATNNITALKIANDIIKPKYKL